MSATRASAGNIDTVDIANRCTAYLQRNSELSKAEIETYSSRIQSGEHDDFAVNISAALQRLQQDIFADLEGKAEDDRDPQGPDVFDLICIEDEKLRVHAAQTRRGQPRTPKDKLTLLTGLEDTAKRKRFGARPKEVTVIREPQPPSTVPLKDLQAIKFSQLKEETHHREQVLFVRRIGNAISQSTRIECVVEDESGDVEALELHHIDNATIEALSEDVYFAIKEPYFTIRGHDVAVLRVDHPSDVVFTAEAHEKLPALLPPLKHERKSAAEWKELGNGHFLKKEFVAARTAYQAALAVVSVTESKLERDIARNLARVDLDLGRYEEARAAAVRAIIGDSSPANVALDVKAYYRAGCASYALKEYDQAADFFARLLALDANDAEGKRELQKSRIRLAERENGTYDFSVLIKRLSSTEQRVDAADFTTQVVMQESPYGGRGLFATREFSIGELVLCERPFCSVFENDKNAFIASEWSEGQLSAPNSATALWQETVRKLCGNPSTRKEVMGLFPGDYEGLGIEDVVVDGLHVIDTFQVHGLISRNAFGIPTPPPKSQRKQPFGFSLEAQGERQLGSNTGLYTYAARINHSCVPNVRKYFLGDLLIFRSTRTISKGEEIFHSYAQVDADVEDRRRLLDTWHFRCDCVLCSTEAKEDLSKRDRRAELGRRGTQLGVAIMNGSLSASEITDAEKLLKTIKSSYDPQLYSRLPRKAAAHLQIGLINHYVRRSQRSRCLAMIADFLVLLGWRVDLTGKNLDVRRKDDCETFLYPQIVDVLLIAGAMQRSAGKGAQTEQLKEFARTLYLAVNGVESGWTDLLKSRGW